MSSSSSGSSGLAARTSSAAAMPAVDLGGAVRDRPGQVGRGGRVGADRRPWPACRATASGSPPQAAIASRVARRYAEGPRPVLRWPAQHQRGHGRAGAGRGSTRRTPAGAPRRASCALAALASAVMSSGVWPASIGRSRASPRSAAGITNGTVSQLRPAAVGRELALGDADQEHRVPLEALGAVDGEQLDRVGLGRGGHVEALAELVLGLQPGQQRGQRDLAVDGLELGDRLHEQVEVVAPGRGGRADRRGELDVDAGDVDDPADQVEDRLADRRTQPAQLVGQQPEPLPRLGGVVEVARVLQRVAQRGDLGRVGALDGRPQLGLDVGEAARRRCWLPASSRARRPSSARSRGPIAQRGPASRVSSAALAVTSCTRVSVATTSDDLGQPEQALEADDLDRDLPVAQRVEDGGGVGVVAGEHADLAARPAPPSRAWRRRSPGRPARPARRRRSRARPRVPRRGRARLGLERQQLGAARRTARRRGGWRWRGSARRSAG